MQLVRLLLLFHVGVTAVLLLLLSLVVLAQRLHGVVTGRRARPTAAAESPTEASTPSAAPAAGASVLDWRVDLRGVGQREAALRT